MYILDILAQQYDSSDLVDAYNYATGELNAPLPQGPADYWPIIFVLLIVVLGLAFYLSPSKKG